MKEIIVYTTNLCGYCNAAKMWLQNHGLNFKEINLDEGNEREIFMEKYPTDDMVYGNIKLYWTFTGPKETLWEDKVYEGVTIFPSNFPMEPPTEMFLTNIEHPNIYISYEEKGVVCISSLHQGIDETGYEDEASRWFPSLHIGLIKKGIVTIFHEPNCESPANIDASNMYMGNREKLRLIIQNNELARKYFIKPNFLLKIIYNNDEIITGIKRQEAGDCFEKNAKK